MRRHTRAPVGRVLAALAATSVLAAAPVARAAGPTDGECGAAGKAAEQLRSTGDFFAARARLSSCLSTACSSQVREECGRKLTSIESAMPGVLLEAKDEASNSITAVRVTMDGSPLVDRLDGSVILVNPGEHRLAFEAAGFRRTEATFVAREPQKALRVVVFLDSARNPAASRLVGSSGEPTRSSGHRQSVGLGLGIAGLAAVGVGTAWAIISKRTYDHALSSECGGDPNRCSTQGISDGKAAHRQATVATITFVAAGALVAAGAALYFTGSREAGVAVAPAVDDRNAGLALVGKW